MYAITKTEKNRTKIPNKLKATLFFSQSSLEELLVFTLSSLKCLWISVEKSWETVELEKSLFDIETNNAMVEGLATYILGEPKKYQNGDRIWYLIIWATVFYFWYYIYVHT